MNTTKQQLNKNTLDILAASHPTPMSFISIFTPLRQIDETLAKHEAHESLGALIAHGLAKKLPETVTQPARYTLTADGVAAAQGN